MRPGPGAAPAPEAVLIAFEFGFLGGSLGEATGDRIEAAYAHARAHRLPVVSLVATGGSRMQEGMRALTQLQRVARQTVLTRRAGLPQLAVVRDPTTGGGWATLAAGADVVLALPGAQVGFAGSRVRPADADPWAYTAEGQHAAGHIDALTEPVDLSDALGRWLALLAGQAAPARRAEPPHALTTGPLPADGAEAVRRTRSLERPRADAYLDAYFDWREEIRGDRTGATDPGMRCGFGHRDGRTVAYAAQCGTATRPAGFRTAARLVRTADRLGIPVLTLIDTPGAANDAAAEQGGAGPAIADLFAAVAEAEVPVTSLLVGEGGSGARWRWPPPATSGSHPTATSPSSPPNWPPPSSSGPRRRSRPPPTRCGCARRTRWSWGWRGGRAGPGLGTRARAGRPGRTPRTCLPRSPVSPVSPQVRWRARPPPCSASAASARAGWSRTRLRKCPGASRRPIRGPVP